MPDMKKDSAGSPQQPSNERLSEEDARLEKDADEMAGAAEKEERQYDRDHDIFTK